MPTEMSQIRAMVGATVVPIDQPFFRHTAARMLGRACSCTDNSCAVCVVAAEMDAAQRRWLLQGQRPATRVPLAGAVASALLVGVGLGAPLPRRRGAARAGDRRCHRASRAPGRPVTATASWMHPDSPVPYVQACRDYLRAMGERITEPRPADKPYAWERWSCGCETSDTPAEDAYRAGECKTCEGTGEVECECADCGHEHQRECDDCGGGRCSPCERHMRAPRWSNLP